MTLNEKPTATIWAKDTDGDFQCIGGVTTDATTPEDAVAQANKIFGIFGKTLVADKNFKRVRTEEAQ